MKYLNTHNLRICIQSLCLFIFVASCQATFPDDGNITGEGGVRSILNGQISNPLFKAVNVVWKENPFSHQGREVRIKVENSGKFQWVCELNQGKRFQIGYGKKWTTVYLLPEGNIDMLFNARTFPDSIEYQTRENDPSIVNTNTYLANQSQNIETDSLFLQVYNPQRELTASEFKQAIKKLIAKEQLLLETFHQEASLHEAFYQEEKINITYKRANALLFFDPLLDPEDTYFEFFKSYPMNLDKGINVQSYQDFVLGYIRHLYRKERMASDDILTSRELDSLRIERQYALAKSSFTGKTRDFVMSQVIYNGLELELGNIDRLYADYTQEAQTTNLKSWVNAAYKVYAGVKGGNLPDNAREVIVENAQSLADLIAQYKGKVVYVDFWASWCKPCRAQFPFSRKLKKSLASDDVVFLYVSLDESDKDWRKAVLQDQVEGEHYRMKGSLKKSVSAKYKIGAIPHYMLINKDGQVIHNKAKSPSDLNIMQEIQSLL